MKTIRLTRYEASDGELFSNKSDCLKYEADGCVDLKELPDYGDHFQLTEKVLQRMMDGDGSCYYATATKMSRIRPHRAPHPAWATHLVYFGK